MNLGRGAKVFLLATAFLLGISAIRSSGLAGLLVPLLLASFIATVSAPLVLWMYDKGVPRGIAVLTALLMDISALAVLGVLIGGSINAFYSRIPRYQADLTVALNDTLGFLGRYGVRPESTSDLINLGSAMDLVGILLQSVGALVSNLVIVLLIVMFMLFEATGLRTKLRTVFGGDPERLHRASQDISKYLGVKTLTSAATGLLVGLWVWIWGLDLPVIWGLLAFLLNYIPTVGSIIAAVPAIVLAWLQLGPGPALGIGIGYLVVNFAIGNFLEPRVFGRALGLSPLIVFLSMIFWGWLLGPIGALLSVPLTMIVKITCANTDDMQWLAALLAPARAPDEPMRKSWIPAALRTKHTGPEAGAPESPDTED